MKRTFSIIFMCLSILLSSKTFGVPQDTLINSLNVENSIERFDEESTEFFYLDPVSMTRDLIRICVPMSYPNWMTVPHTSIASMTELGTVYLGGKKLLKVKIVFTDEYSQFNTILDAFKELVILENQHTDLGIPMNEMAFNWGWKPPWTWSKCAKCKLGVNAFITATVFVAMSGAGPGALAVAKALIAAEYGAAAWAAVEAVIMSASVSEISRKICKARGDC